MQNNEYIDLANRTAKELGSEEMELFHIALGLGGEAGEFQDAVKKAFIYGKDPDWTNMDEEIGDLLWYVARYCRITETSFENLMMKNINKLERRFGSNKFTKEEVFNRDLGAERTSLETTKQPIEGDN